MRTVSTILFLFSLLIQPTNQIFAENTAPINPVPAISIIAPDDITVSCDVPWTFGRPVITANGECAQFTLDSLSDEYDYGECAQSYTVTRTWIATDECQGTATGSQTITVEDITPPTIIKPADKTISCSRKLVYDEPTGTDNCGVPTFMRFDTVQVSKDCYYQVLVPWIAIDDCGNQSDTVWQKITLIDTVAPSIQAPANKTVSCDEIWSFGNPVVTDSCSSFEIITVSTQSSTISCGQRVIRTWYAIDDCDNASPTVSQTVDVLDQTAPSIIPPADKTIYCQDNLIWNDPVTSDNCTTGTLVVDSTRQQNQSCGYTTIRYWHAIDDCGNKSGSVHQKITVLDTTPPHLTPLENKTVNCDQNWTFDMPMVTDNCDPFAFLHQITGTQVNLACGYQVTKKWYATDNCGNTSDTAYQTVIVVDNQPPTLYPLMDKNINCGENITWSTPMGVDNCDEDLEYHGDQIIQEALECGYRYIRTWYAIDDCGNTSNLVTQTITITDNEPPIIDPLTNLTISCTETPQWETPNAFDECDEDLIMDSRVYSIPAACGYTLVRAWVAIDHCQNVSDTIKQFITIIDDEEPNIDEPEDKTVYCGDDLIWDVPAIEDNCDEDAQIIASDIEREDLVCGYILTRSWIGVDACGNESDPVYQTITVLDDEAPVLSQPEDKTVACDDTWTWDIPTVDDNCEEGLQPVGSEPVRVNQTCGYTLTRTWTATDACGNQSEPVSQTITVTDDEAPVLSQPEDRTVACDDTWTWDIPTVDDNCEEGLQPVGSEPVRVNQTCGYTLTRTWTATDACGNQSEPVSQTITVTDDEAPVLSQPEDRTVACDDTWTWDIPTVDDNCEEGLQPVGSEPVRVNQTCGYTLTRTWTATDACGNQSEPVSQTITVTDDEAPVLSQPEDRTVACDDTWTWDIPTVDDNCEEGLQPVGSEPVRVNQTCGYTLTRTWTATDACGNQSEPVSQTITVLDDEAPVLSQPEDKTVACDDTWTWDIPTVDDNCEEGLQPVGSEPVRVNQTCGYTLTRTWTATDACGNQSEPVSQTITVTDDEAPVLSQPEDRTVACDDTWTWDIPTVDDNCEEGLQPVGSEPVRVNQTCGYTLTRTWTATDACGNQSEPVSQTITVTDDEAPVLSQPEDRTVACDDTWTWDIPTVDDNCEEGLQPVGSEPVRVNQTCGYTLTRTWTATDACGNQSEPVSQTITVLDDEAPVLSQPEDKTVACDDTWTWDIPTVDDNCEEGLQPVGSEPVRVNQTCGYTLTRTWTATDACGNQSEPVSQTITVTDDEAPVLSQPEDRTVACDDTWTWDIPTVDDNCEEGLQPVGSEPVRVNQTCGYTLTRTWTATDACGNQSEPVSQTITVTDDEAPVLSQPEDRTVACDDTWTWDIPTVDDNCEEGLQPVGSEPVRVNQTCGYTLTRTWTATDACGNQSEPVSQTITVTDDEAPVLSQPEDRTVACDDTWTWDIPTVDDNCEEGLQPVGSEPVREDLACGYTLTRTWTTTDACGNQSEPVSQTITVTDDEAPVLSQPEDRTVACDDTWTWDIPTVDDNCEEGLQPVGSEPVRVNQTCGYTLTRTWTATDECGNQSEPVSQTVTVIDTEAPVLSQPEDKTVTCDDNWTWDQPTVDDNCEEGLNPVGSEPVREDLACGYTLTRTWTATDECGNQSEPVSQTITVTDDEAPVLSQPEDKTVTCDDNWTWDIPTVDDNCEEGLNPVGSEPVREDLACGYTLTRTWTATDECGNQSEPVSQTVTVIDTEAPVLSQPEDKTVTCDDNWTWDQPTVDDNCEEGLNPVGSEPVREDLACGYTLTRTWTATDECGNQSEPVSQTVTVIDTEAPVLSQPEDKTVTCDDNWTWDQPTVDDNCEEGLNPVGSEPVREDLACGYTLTRTWTATDECGNQSEPVSQTVTVIDTEAPVLSQPEDKTVTCDDNWTWDQPTVDDNCEEGLNPVGSEPVREDLACGYTLTRTWTATDECGNQSEPVSQTVTVIDTEAPVLSQPEDKTVTCDDNWTWDQPTVDDNCEEGLNPVGSEPVREDLACGYTLTRTWTATDACGNQSEPVSQTVTVIDTEAPVLSQPEDKTVTCDDNWTWDIPTVDDNCEEGLNPVGSEPVREDLACGYTLTRTWTATDECGNQSEPVSQTVTVIDTEAPVLSQPEDKTVTCDDNWTWDQPTVDDNCEEGLNPVGSEPVREDLACGYTLTRTWTATDECGNQSEPVSQTVTVIDTEAPVLSQPEDKTVTCDDNWTWDQPTVDDNCEEGLNPVGSEPVREDLACGYTLTRTWTATDECGNQSEPVSQTVTVIDTEAPVLSQPEDKTVTCDDNWTWDQPTVDDNCEEGLNPVGSEPVREDLACGYTLTRTWTATDECGNQSEPVSQTVTVIDTEAPVLSQPEDKTVTCDDNWTWDQPTVDDNCEEGLNPVGSEPVREDLACGYTLTRTWTATDECGNQSEPVSQTVTVIDTEAPVLSQPEDKTVTCDDNWTWDIPTVDDNCEEGLNPVGSEPVREDLACGYTLTRTWTATDECGNQSEPVSQTVTVIDTEAPVLSQPEDKTVTCDDNWTWDQPTVDDNCEEGLNPVGSEPVREDLACGYTLTRTWTATDECGNQSEPVSQTVTVIDTEAPSISKLDNITVTCETWTWSTPEIEDNCSEAILIEGKVDSIGLACGYQLSKTWYAIDNCGNQSPQVTQYVTVEDGGTPTFDTKLADITISCNDPMPAAPTVRTIGCTQSVVRMVEEIQPMDCGEMLIRTYTAEMPCGDDMIMEQRITVIDDLSPKITELKDKFLSCNDEITWDKPYASDNCSSVSLIEGPVEEEASSCGYILTKTWYAVDECGNQSNVVSQTITVDNTSSITLTPPQDIYLSCTDVNELPGSSEPSVCEETTVYYTEGGHSITFEGYEYDKENNQTCYSYTIHSNIDPEISHSMIGDLDMMDCATCIGGEARISKADPTTQAYGCKWDEGIKKGKSKTYVICVEGSPELGKISTSIKYGRRVSTIQICGPASCESVNPPIEDKPLFGKPEVSVDCPVDYEIIEGEVIRQDLDCGYVLTKSWYAVSDCGGQTEPVTQHIYYIDETAPVINPVTDKTVSCNENWQWDKPEISDDCSSVSLIEGKIETKQLECGYQITKTWTAKDDCGNESGPVTQTITVIDETAPTFIDIPEDLTLSCIEDIPSPTVHAVDDCSEVKVTMKEETSSSQNQGCTIVNMDRPQEQAPRIGWFQNMPGANSNLFNVESGNFEQYGDGTAHFYGVVSNINNSNLAWEFDIWMRGGYNWDDWHALGRGYKDAGIAGNNYLDWTYYEMDDSKSNTLTGLRAYDGSELNLTHNPSNYYYGFQVGQNANVFTNTYGMSGWFNYSGTIVYNNHEYQRNSINSDFNLNLGCTENSTGCTTTILRTWTATDACGNTTSMSQSITISDHTKPSISPLEDKFYSCDEDWTWDMPVAQDECGTPDMIEGVETRTNTECGYQVSKSWYAIDACGNQSEIVTQTITVEDNEPPVFITTPQDIHLSCGQTMPDFTPLAAVDNCDGNVTVVYKDSTVNQGSHCDVVNMDWSNESDPRIGWFQNMPGASSLLFHVEQGGFDQFAGGTAHFYGTVSNVNNDQLAWEFDIWMRNGSNWEEWSAMGRGYKNSGIAGNNYLDWTYYEMDDSKANTFTGIRAYAGSHLSLTHNPSNYYYGFQIGENANVFTYTYGMSGWFTYYGDIVYNGNTYHRNGVNSDFNLNLGCTNSNNSCGTTVIRTTIATDHCGNQATVTQTITRDPDNTPPTISALQDKSYSCNEDWSWDAPVAEDNCGTPQLIEGLEVRSEIDCGYMMSKSWYAIDACGNQSEIVTQNITVLDDEAPIFIGNTGDIILSCGQPIPDFTPLTVVDNCDGNVTVTYQDSMVTEGGSHCDLVNMDWSNESDPRIGWFQNMPGASSLLFHVEQGGLDQFADGTAHFYGTVSNVNNDQLAWEFDIWMRNGSNWEEWSAMGRGYKNSGIAGNNYLDWTYYEMDDSKANTFTGIRAYAGSQLSLTHNPSNYYYGFQVGENANVFTYTYGMSGWFTYYGDIVYNGNTYHRNGVNSDFNLNLGCTEQSSSCGVTIYRTTTATDKCGNQASVTQKISVPADHEPPVVVNPPNVECITPITFESFFNNNWSLTATDNCSPDITVDIPEINWDCEAGKYILTYVFTDNCGNQTTFTRDVCIEGSSPVCSIIAPNEISTQASNTFMADVTGGMDPMQYEWTILSGNWNITSGGNSSTVNLDAGSDHLILELTVTDQNGCSSTCTVEADAPTSDLGGGCTLTQGFYGNDRGRYCDGRQTTPLITDLMASGPIVLGKPGRSFTLNSNDVACIIGLLGGGGPSVALNSGNGSCGSFNFSTRTSKGVATSKNTLVSQAITLALNMRLDGNLGSTQIMGNCMTTASSSNCGANGNAYPVPGTEQTFCFSTAVLQILGTGFTISELFDLASRALGGENVGVGLGDITDALGFINDGFDECRIVTSWSVTNSITEPDGDDLNTTSVEINTTVGKITAYPNPTVNLVKLAFEIPVATEEGNIQIVNGQGIPVYKETTPMQKGAKELQINTEGWTPGPYYVIVRVNAYIMYGQFIRVE